MGLILKSLITSLSLSVVTSVICLSTMMVMVTAN